MAGLLILAPLFLTVVVVGYLVRLTDNFVVNPLFQILPLEVDAKVKVLLAKLAIAFLVALFVIVTGLLAEKFIFKRMFLALEQFLGNVPFFSAIYNSIKEIAIAFFGSKKGVFQKVVFLEYPRKGIYTVGFVTQDKNWEIHAKTGRDVLTVFVPTPPNPATGNFVFVPKEELVESDLTIEEGIRLVISGGAAVPQKGNEELRMKN